MEKHNDKETGVLLNEAKQRMIEDMTSRGIGAIIWSIPDAGFHYIPEIVVNDSKGEPHTMRVTGLYHINNTLYAIEEDVAKVSIEEFYTPGVDVPPVVVTLSEDKARERLGDPTSHLGFTTRGSLEEWVAVADCYFEALAEED